MAQHGKILIVDDNPLNIEILEERLEDYQTLAVESGEAALEIAPEFQPDIVLLDIMLPGDDGYDVCRRMRHDPSLKRTKIIMVSAKAMLEERLKGYAAGADDYLTKPFEGDELVAKARVYLRLKTTEEFSELKNDLLKLLHLETYNPLGCIISPVEMLLSSPEMPFEERKMWYEMIGRSAKSIQYVFEKVMTLGLLKSGNQEFQLEPGDPCTVVREVIMKSQATAMSRNVAIEQQLSENNLVAIDRKQLSQAFTAVLDNAIRFSPENDRVLVKIVADEQEVCMTVNDHGEGIDESFAPHIFDELTSDTMGYHAAGHGFNLAIAYLILEAHDGGIRFEQDKESGTTFFIRLPLLQGDAAHPISETL